MQNATAHRKESVEGKETMWHCPGCGKEFRNHFFPASTPAAGPVCDACCTPLRWEAVPVHPRSETAGQIAFF